MKPTELKTYKRLEKRRFSRAKDNIFFFCQLEHCPQKIIEGITTDIGGGGMAFETERHFFPATDLELEIYQPLNLQKTAMASIFAKARVAWVKDLEEVSTLKNGRNRYEVGIKFINIKTEDRKKIVKYIDKKLER